MVTQVGDLTKSVINRSPANDPLLYSDINGRQLVFPTLVFPFRRLLLWVAKTAYDNAMRSPASHACAIASCPEPELWVQLFTAVGSDGSDGFKGSGCYQNLVDTNYASQSDDEEDVYAEEDDEDAEED
jgi:hypothetical protein